MFRLRKASTALVSVGSAPPIRRAQIEHGPFCWNFLICERRHASAIRSLSLRSHMASTRSLEGASAAFCTASISVVGSSPRVAPWLCARIRRTQSPLDGHRVSVVSLAKVRWEKLEGIALQRAGFRAWALSVVRFDPLLHPLQQLRLCAAKLRQKAPHPGEAPRAKSPSRSVEEDLGLGCVAFLAGAGVVRGLALLQNFLCARLAPESLEASDRVVPTSHSTHRPCLHLCKKNTCCALHTDDHHAAVA
eukprot:scaffold636_cov252-Pinguiococcus_pyrenoidosus.AAC.2